MKLLPLPAFNDNYFWMLILGEQAVVIDPGQADPVLQALEEHQVRLATILITHHHADHIAGVQELTQKTNATVYAPNHPSIPAPFTLVGDNEWVHFLGLSAQVIAVPGHTLTHVAYYAQHSPLGPLLFCGDTLFSAGCGRMFEGDPVGFLESLDKLAALQAPTLVCAAHEYTLANLRFALAVEPNNQDLIQYTERCKALREQNIPTLPSTIGQERLVNPFLRVREKTVIDSARHFKHGVSSPVEVFAALRAWKNEF